MGDFVKRRVLHGGYFPVRIKHHDSSLVAFKGRDYDFLKILFRDDAAPVNRDAVADPGFAPQAWPRATFIGRPFRLSSQLV